MDNFIKTSFDKIREAIEFNKLVIFVGAGVSSSSGLPSWEDLINEFYIKLYGKLHEGKLDSSEYLKIPQLFYNDRKEKEYNDLIDKVFNTNVEPNPIHELLFDLNPVTIITTNYDDLIEQQAELSREKFYVVKKDHDLPYSTTNKMIIKMHGDLKERNIVLKEDDYLSYSHNFPLIENHIKDLVATHTILFIGYSVRDWDFNIIFKFVKNILQEHFQPAYLLNVTGAYNRLDFDYYKNRGINIIYGTELERIKNTKTDDINEKTVCLIKTILTNDDLIDNLYQKLIVFEDINYINNGWLYKICSDFNISLHENIIFINNKELINIFMVFYNYTAREFIRFLKNKTNFKIRVIVEIVLKSKIRMIGLNKGRFDLTYLYKFANRHKNDEFLDKLSNLDFIGIKNELDIFESNDLNSMLKQAFYYHLINDHTKSYLALKELSYKAYKRLNYIYQFFADLNRLQIDLFLDINVSKKIDNELDRIDLDELFTKLPYSMRKKIDYLKQIPNFNFIYTKIRDISQKFHKIINSKNSNNINDLLKDAKDLWHTIYDNFLIVSHYDDTRFAFSTCAKSILICCSRKQIVLDDFILLLFVDFMSTNELEHELNANSIDALKFDNQDKIPVMLQNAIKSIILFEKSDSGFYNFRIYEKIERILIVLSYISISDNNLTLLLPSIKELVSKNSSKRKLKYLVKFIDKQGCFKDKVEFLRELLTISCDKHFDDLEYIRDLSSAIFKIFEYNQKYLFIENFPHICKVLDLIENYEKKNKHPIYIHTIIHNIYKLVNSDDKSKILNKSVELLNQIIITKNIEKFNDIFNAIYQCDKQIINTKTYKSAFLEFLKTGAKTIEMDLLRTVVKDGFLTESEVLINCQDVLKTFNSYIDVKKIREDNFKLDYLLNGSYSDHQKIKQTPELYEIVKERLKEELEKENCDIQYKKLITDYYL